MKSHQTYKGILMIQMFLTMRKIPIKKITIPEIEDINKRGSRELSARMNLQEMKKTSTGIHLAIPSPTTTVESNAMVASTKEVTTEEKETEDCPIGGDVAVVAIGLGSTNSQSHLARKKGTHPKRIMKEVDQRRKEVPRNIELQNLPKVGETDQIGKKIGKSSETQNLQQKYVEGVPEVQVPFKREISKKRNQLIWLNKRPSDIERILKVLPLKSASDDQSLPTKRNSVQLGTDGVGLKAPLLREYSEKSLAIPARQGSLLDISQDLPLPWKAAAKVPTKTNWTLHLQREVGLTTTATPIRIKQGALPVPEIDPEARPGAQGVKGDDHHLENDDQVAPAGHRLVTAIAVRG